MWRSGGLELLFNNQKSLDIQTPEEIVTLGALLPFIRDHYLKERDELFMQGNSVRPGILVLINDVDWEIEGQLDYLLRPDDTITFISTLHGG